MTDPTLPPGEAATAAAVAQAHAALATTYTAAGNHRRATQEAQESRRWLDLLAPSHASLAAVLEERTAAAAVEDLAARVHADDLDRSLLGRLRRMADEFGPRGVAEALEQMHPGAHPAPPAPEPAGSIGWALDWPHLEPPAALLTDDDALDLAAAYAELTAGDMIPLGDDLSAAGQGTAAAAAIRQAVRSLTLGSRLVAQERRRQIEQEGYHPAEDLEQVGVLAQAAGCYLLAAHAPHPEDLPVPGSWPWPPETWKPSADPVRNLVKAAALVTADVDARLLHQANLDALPWYLVEVDDDGNVTGTPGEVKAGPFPSEADADRHARLLARSHPDDPAGTPADSLRAMRRDSAVDAGIPADALPMDYPF